MARQSMLISYVFPNVFINGFLSPNPLLYVSIISGEWACNLYSDGVSGGSIVKQAMWPGLARHHSGGANYSDKNLY